MIDRDVGVAVAATAGLLSPRAREVMRKGAVYGLAGALKVGDVVVGTARGAARGASEGATGSGNGVAATGNGAGASAPPDVTSSPTGDAAPVAEPATSSRRQGAPGSEASGTAP
jgi:hypothetical protein